MDIPVLTPRNLNSRIAGVAHRLATVVDADQIIVLERGRIVGIGKHHELLNTVPLYESLAQSQLLT